MVGRRGLLGWTRSTRGTSWAAAATIVAVIAAGFAGAVLPTAPAVAKTRVSPTSVAALPVTKGAVYHGARLTSSGGFRAGGSAAAVTLPRARKTQTVSAKGGFSRERSRVIGRSEYTQTYQNPDGTRTLEESVTPLNVKTSSGAWTPVSTSVVDSSATKGLGVLDNPVSPRFARTAGGAEYSVSSGKYTASFHLMGARRVDAGQATAQDRRASGGSAGSSVAYRDILPNTNLAYEVEPGAVKESLVLTAPPSSTNPSWSWRIHAPGLTLSKDRLGDILYKNDRGTVEFVTPIPAMEDSSGVTGVRGPAITNVPTTLKDVGGGDWMMTLTPSSTWLNDPSRVFPVYVDPSTASDATENAISYESNGTELTGVSYVGNSEADGNTYWRSMDEFNYEALYGDHVFQAEIEEVYDGNGTLDQTTGGVYSASGFGYGDISTELSGITISSGSSGYGYATGADLTSDIANLVNTEHTGVYQMLAGQETSGLYTFKQVAVEMFISYEPDVKAAITHVTVPDPDGFAATTSSPAGGTASSTPTLSVSASGGSGSYVGYDYFVATNASMASADTLWSSGWVGIAQAQVPTAVLSPGTMYYWRVEAEDSYGVTAYTPVYDWTTSTNPTVGTAPPEPGDGSIVSNLTPTLVAPTATSTNGESLSYAIRITTGDDGVSGQVALSPVCAATGSSCVLDTTTGTVTWSVPSGLLNDSSSYTWDEIVNDADDDWVPTVQRMTVNLRVSTPGPSPTDTEGPVTVNLANGNVAASFSSPTVQTVGGPMGMSFDYDSELPGNAGLTGSYYNVTPASGQSPVFSFSSSTLPAPSLVRTDTDVNFNWSGGETPGPGVPSTDFMAQWTGYISPPPGTYQFGFQRDDGAELWLGSGSSLHAVIGSEQWNLNSGYTTQWSSTEQYLDVAANGLTATVDGETLSLPIPVTVQYYQNQGVAHVALEAQSVVGGQAQAGTAQVVPASWFTKSQQILPSGWSGSGAIAGDADAYSGAQVHEGYVTLLGTDGETYTFTKTSTGGYTAPPGMDGVLTTDQNGGLSFTDSSGTVYLFNAAGQVTSVTTPEDLTHPAEPVPAYNSSGQLTSLSDPLSSNGASPPVYARQVRFTYLNATSAAASGTGVGDCAPPSGSSFTTDLDAGMLCQIAYPDGSTTQLYYDVNGQLAQVVDPGNAVTDFGYLQQATGPLTGQYLLSRIQSPTATDWLASQGDTGTPPTTVDTTIGYDETTDATAGYATSVTLPAPDGTTATQQPQKTYAYLASASTTDDGSTLVEAAGEPTERLGRVVSQGEIVTFNQSLQQISVRNSISELTSQSFWNGSDDLMASIDPQGHETSTAYDSQNRATDTFGPAPSSCFPSLSSATDGQVTTDQEPSAGITGDCAALNTPVAHTSTTYDGAGALAGHAGGLNATWYNNTTLSGAPAAESVSIPAVTGAVGGATDGSIDYDWSTSTAGTVGLSPITGPTGTVVGGASGTDWSAMFTGLVTFPTAGTYQLYMYDDDGTELWLNDRLVIDDWGTHSPHYSTAYAVTATAGEVMRIRLAYENLSEGAQLQLDWATPGTSVPTTVADNVPIPAVDLSPDYSLVTSTTTDDSAPSGVTGVSSAQVPSTSSSTSYGSDPWLGQVASSTVDPGGLNLTSTATYETGTGGYNRQLTSTEPAGSGTTSTDAYYPATTGYGTVLGLSSAVCGVPLSTPQYGMLESTTGPAPAVGSAITTQYVYDAMGRVVGSRNTESSAWSCTTYDARGLVTAQSYPALDGNPAYTVTDGYYADGATSSPLVTTTSSPVTGSPNGGTITTVTNLDGQVTSYTDVWGTLTTTAYNQIGQVTGSTTTEPDGTATTLAFTYDVDGQVTDETVNGTDTAQATYSDGVLTQVTLPADGGVTGTPGYSPTGAQDSIAWTLPSGTTVTDAQTLSQAGRALQDLVTTATSSGTTTDTSTYTYDAAGRLTQAVIPGNTLTYGFGTATCGANTAAGADGDRTSFTDVYTGGSTPTTTSTSYCYDNADELTGTTVTNPPTGADPVVADDLTETGTTPTLAYDGDGNTTTLADQTLSYNGDDELTSVTSTGGGVAANAATIDYVRDATGRVVQETTTSGGVTHTYDYSYDGTGALGGILVSGKTTDTTLTLPGGITDDIQASTQAWSFPNLHSDTMLVTNGTGQQQGATELYDPFGNPLGAANQLQTITTNTGLTPTTSMPNTTQGFAGGAGRLTDTLGDIDETQMGARQYSPELGRFLQMDPVPGGNSNAYNYPGDPINTNDYTGEITQTILSPDYTLGGPVASSVKAESHVSDSSYSAPYRAPDEAASSRTSSSQGGSGDEGSHHSTTKMTPHWTTADTWAAIGIGLGMVALACTGVGIFADVGVLATAVAYTGIVAGASGTAIDAYSCFEGRSRLGCVGMAFDAASTGFGVGGTFAGELGSAWAIGAAGPGAVGFGIDTYSDVQTWEGH